MAEDTSIKRGIYNCPNCGGVATPQSVRCAYCHSSLASLICSSCFGAIFTGMKHCPWCGAEASFGKPTERAPGKCPRCAEAFLLVIVGNRTLSECPGCGGLWVDKDTLQQLCSDREEQEAVLGFDFGSRAPADESAAKPDRLYIPCPECGKLMNRANFAGCSGVVVDWCKPHGTWFDRDELHQIVDFIQAGGLRKSREHERMIIEEEKLHLQEQKRSLSRIAQLAPAETYAHHSLTRDPDSFFDLLSGIWRTLDK